MLTAAAAAAEHSKECKRPKWQHFFLYVLLALLGPAAFACVWYSSVVVVVAVDVVYATRSFAQAKRRHLV